MHDIYICIVLSIIYFIINYNYFIMEIKNYIKEIKITNYMNCFIVCGWNVSSYPATLGFEGSGWEVSLE